MVTRFVVAVSGGVDSVVLLDMMVDELIPADRLIVAHFDHGIRPESADDAIFVAELAKKYDLLFETKREELGAGASEELARDRRYAFLREVAAKHDAKIMTAHHADDVIETIAINLTRGTGWRGLAVLDNSEVERPLLGKTKAELVAYATDHNLQWREDATNSDAKYLRNSLRQKLKTLDELTKELLRRYRDRQVVLKNMIDTETDAYMTAPYSRYFFTNLPTEVAFELLRGVMVRETGQSVVRPLLEKLLLAIKTYQAGKRIDIDAQHEIVFARTDFVIRKR
jgi:tRNA(Ile)-lysidine synthase